LPFSSLSQLVQPLNKWCMKNLAAVTSPNSNVPSEDSAIRQMELPMRVGEIRLGNPVEDIR
jgi:hypothetical protein